MVVKADLLHKAAVAAGTTNNLLRNNLAATTIRNNNNNNVNKGNSHFPASYNGLRGIVTASSFVSTTIGGTKNIASSSTFLPHVNNNINNGHVNGNTGFGVRNTNTATNGNNGLTSSYSTNSTGNNQLNLRNNAANTPSNGLRGGNNNVLNGGSHRGNPAATSYNNSFNGQNAAGITGWNGGSMIGSLEESVPGGGVPGVEYPILDEVPITQFSCSGRQQGYYGDTETRCQVSSGDRLAQARGRCVCDNDNYGRPLGV